MTDLESRLVTIADEACGIGPVEPIEETLTRIERKLSDDRIELEIFQPFRSLVSDWDWKAIAAEDCALLDDACVRQVIQAAAYVEAELKERKP